MRFIELFKYFLNLKQYVRVYLRSRWSWCGGVIRFYAFFLRENSRLQGHLSPHLSLSHLGVTFSHMRQSSWWAWKPAQNLKHPPVPSWNTMAGIEPYNGHAGRCWQWGCRWWRWRTLRLFWLGWCVLRSGRITDRWRNRIWVIYRRRGGIVRMKISTSPVGRRRVFARWTHAGVRLAMRLGTKDTFCAQGSCRNQKIDGIYRAIYHEYLSLTLKEKLNKKNNPNRNSKQRHSHRTYLLAAIVRVTHA